MSNENVTQYPSQIVPTKEHVKCLLALVAAIEGSSIEDFDLGFSQAYGAACASLGVKPDPSLL